MIYSIASLVLVLLMFIGIPWGIFVDIKARGEQDQILKKKMHRKALYIGFGPVIILFAFIFLHAFITALFR